MQWFSYSGAPDISTDISYENLFSIVVSKVISTDKKNFKVGDVVKNIVAIDVIYMHLS